MSNTKTVSAAIELALELISQATAVSQVVAQAQSESRTTLTDAEWASITGGDDAARAALVQADAGAKV